MVGPIVVDGAISSRKGAYKMKQKPYFNNPRAKAPIYTGVPRNRAERRAMAKRKGQLVEKFNPFKKLKTKFQELKEKVFTPSVNKQKAKDKHVLTDAEIEAYEQKQINELKKAQTNLKREITRRENKAIKDYVEAQNADKVNDSIDYASSLYGGNTEYTSRLLPLMRDLLDNQQYQPKPGDENQYFKISTDYTGQKAELFKYVEFKKIPEKFDKDVEAIEEMDWSSPENYYEHLADINNQKYMSNVNQMDIPVTPQVIDALSQIMNTSAAWSIAGKWTSDSDQVQQNWMALFDAGQKALNTDNNVFDRFIQMIRVEEDLSYILEEVDNLVYQALKE